MSLEQLVTLSMYAWVGKDEHGSGQIGMKQTLGPKGILASADLGEAGKQRLQAMTHALMHVCKLYGEKMHFCRFDYAGVAVTIEPGKWAADHGMPTAPTPTHVNQLELYAWVREKDTEFVIQEAHTTGSGLIPVVAIGDHRTRIEHPDLLAQLQKDSDLTKSTLRLTRFKFSLEIAVIKPPRRIGRG